MQMRPGMTDRENVDALSPRGRQCPGEDTSDPTDVLRLVLVESAMIVDMPLRHHQVMPEQHVTARLLG